MILDLGLFSESACPFDTFIPFFVFLNIIYYFLSTQMSFIYYTYNIEQQHNKIKRDVHVR